MKVALIGGGAYLAYKYVWPQFSGAPATLANPTSSSGTADSSTATPAVPATIANPFTGKSLASIYAAVNSAAGAGFMGTVDDWDWYLMQVVPGWTTPDPGPIFSALNFTPPWTRDTKMPLASYWIAMGPYLAQHQGLTGFAGTFDVPVPAGIDTSPDVQQQIADLWSSMGSGPSVAPVLPAGAPSWLNANASAVLMAGGAILGLTLLARGMR